MSKFISSLADDFESMLSYREALGFSRRSHESILMNFDRYIADHYPEAISLGREMVTVFIDGQIEKSRGGIAKKATAVRLFGKYLSAIGKPSYVLPDEYVSQPKTTFTPYIFTDDELARLFNAADRQPINILEPLAPKIPPVLFRLIYTCGLRPNEGRELLRKNINFKTGEIFIIKTKRKKERIVVMSGDMLMLCKKYDAVRNTLNINSEYFFPCYFGHAYTSNQLDRWFKECWADANPNIPADNLPNVRVYDLRHRFASACLNKWLDEKRNLYNMLPYLREYMGHSAMSETAYYIHILPENLVKSAGIEWESLEAMIPDDREVTSWQE